MVAGRRAHWLGAGVGGRLWLETEDGVLRADEVGELRVHHTALRVETAEAPLTIDDYEWLLLARPAGAPAWPATPIVVAGGDGYCSAVAVDLAHELVRHGDEAGLVGVRTAATEFGADTYIDIVFRPWPNDRSEPDAESGSGGVRR